MDAGFRCTSDDDCADLVFCNGMERCRPEDPRADTRGCTPGMEPCVMGEECLESEGRCEGECRGDEDGDGHESTACGGMDCDDDDPNRYPSNTEVCDSEGIDEDCDPRTLGDDADGDGFVDASCCNVDADGALLCGDDCDDSMPGVHPGQPDDCNAIDDDCDGNLDENPTFVFYRDVDGDNAGDSAFERTACSRPDGYASDAGDCDDMDEQIHPGAPERCQEALIDDDCDGTANEDCACTTGDMQTCGPDEGNQGNCMTADQTCTEGTWPATCVGAVYPGTEVCDGGDEDCDGMVDEAGASDAMTIYRDRDGDGYGVATETMQSCTIPSGWTDTPGDCDDDAVLIRPGVADVCDGVDNDCNGSTDPGCACMNDETRPCPDGLAEVGDCQLGTQTCTGGVWGDCIGETVARTEMCGGGDEDCDGSTDEATGASPAADAQTYYGDSDGDMYGDPNITQVACSLGSGWELNSDDCNDGVAAISPLANEICDGVDNDCDDSTDENPDAANNSCTTSFPVGTTSTCSGSMCVITGCPSGFDDCINGYADGCETDLTDSLDHCGACNNGCTFDCNESGCNDLVSIQTGTAHSCALTEQGQVSCWGANADGQLGNSSTNPTSSPDLVSNLMDAVHLAIGYGHTCAIRTGGQAVCWGDNEYSQLGVVGVDRTTPVSVSSVPDAAFLAAGNHHTCVVRTNGTAACWGEGVYGQLGWGTDADSSIPQTVIDASSSTLTGLVEISAGRAHTCARTSGGTVYCWGVHSEGQIGNGVADQPGDDCEVVSSPVVITSDCAMAAVPVMGLTDATQVSAGNEHTCALRTGGTVVCWGRNTAGQLGDSSFTSAFSTSPITVEGITDAVAVSTGTDFSCARRAGGPVLCWGEGALGRLGVGDETDRTSPTPIDGGLSVTHLGEATGAHGCVLTTAGAAYCWGANASGQLGDATGTPSSSPVPVSPL